MTREEMQQQIDHWKHWADTYKSDADSFQAECNRLRGRLQAVDAGVFAPDLRDRFAMAAMAGIYMFHAHRGWLAPDPIACARQAYRQADAMLAARERKGEG